MKRAVANTPTLLLKPRPYACESLAGYQLRVAEANGYPSGIWLSNYLLETPRITINTSDHAASIASILGLQPEELSRLAYTYDHEPPRNYVRYFGQKLHLRHIKIKSPAICSLCLKERAVTNGFWELKYAVACPFHGIRLFDSCQQCGQRISWNRSHVCACTKCEFDYRDSVVDIAAPEVLELVRLLYATANVSLLAAPNEAEPSLMPLAALRSERLSALIWMFSYISRSFPCETEVLSTNRRSGYENRLGAEYQDVLETAHFLSEWPERLLENVYMKVTSKSQYLATKSMLMGLSAPKMPVLFQQIGNAFIESARLIHGLDYKVDRQTLEHARLKVGTCFS